MKKILWLLGLSFSLINSSVAQNKGYGIGFHTGLGDCSYMLLLPMQTGLSFEGGESVGFGFSFINQFSRYFALTHEMHFISSSANDVVSEGGPYRYTEKYYFNHLEIPLCFKSSIGIANTIFFKAYLGGGVNINLGSYSARYYKDSTINSMYGYTSQRVMLAPYQLCLLAGGGLDIQFKKGNILSCDIKLGEAATEFGTISRGTLQSNRYELYGPAYTHLLFRYIHPLQIKKSH